MYFYLRKKVKRAASVVCAALLIMSVCMPTAVFAMTEAECNARAGRCTLTGCPADFSASSCALIMMAPYPTYKAEKAKCVADVKLCTPTQCQEPAEQNVGPCDGFIGSNCCSTQRIAPGTSGGAGNMLEAKCDPKGDACGGCIVVVKPASASGGARTGEEKYEDCPDKSQIWFGDCVCNTKEGGTNPEQSGMGYLACQSLCVQKGGTINETEGIGLHKPQNLAQGGGSGRVSSVTSRGANALCFTPQECADLDGTFNGTDPKCPGGKGKCLAPEPTLTLSSAILGQTSVTGLRNYIPLIFNYALSISLVVASIMFVIAGFQYIYSGGVKGAAEEAKEKMVNATVGLVLLFGAQALLATINPSILDLTKLNVYMINPQSFLQFNYCKDFKKADKSSPMFALTGIPPGSVGYESASFNIPVTDVDCNFEYYAQGFPLNICMGNRCRESGKVCVPCVSSIDECKKGPDGKPKKSTDYVCATSVFGGTIHYEDDAAPLKMYMLPVCNWIQPAKGQKFNSAWVGQQIPMALDMNLTPGGPGSGYAYYRTFGDIKKFEELDAACKSHGGLRGVVIGMIYNDPFARIGNLNKAASNAVDQATIAGATTALIPIPGSTVGGVAMAALGGFFGTIPANDAVIITKDKCQPAPGLFYGYTNGTRTSYDSTDMKTAFYCGSVMTPGKTPVLRALDGSTTGNSSIYWTPDEVRAAFAGTKSLTCDFGLNKQNAPSDPGTALQRGCQANWECNDAALCK